LIVGSTLPQNRERYTEGQPKKPRKILKKENSRTFPEHSEAESHLGKGRTPGKGSTALKKTSGLIAIWSFPWGVGKEIGLNK